MQTRILTPILKQNIGQEANDILRSCVHCGFCTATCPTYQLLGDELDSPRGRIYLIKNLLETGEASQKTQIHLDRCLSCGACETTCPSGVKYRRLRDIGQEMIERHIQRPLLDKIKRKILSHVLLSKNTFRFLLRSAQTLRPLLPATVKNRIPQKQTARIPTPSHHARKMILFRGCVHDALAPEINASAINVLDKLEISVLEVDELRCCGSVTHHLHEKEKTEFIIKRNIDALLEKLTPNVEAIFTTASACSLMLKEYPAVISHNAEYHKKALQLIDKVKDISEIICAETLDKLKFKKSPQKIAFHNPCSLQHGLKITLAIEEQLINAGYQLTNVTDAHLCCGSAGTYALLQPKLSKQLLSNKINNLTREEPEMIATANIGCLAHIQSECKIPVKHWITLIDHQLR